MMKKIIFIILMLCSTNIAFASDCLYMEGYKVKSWTGECVEGVVTGDGKLLLDNNFIYTINKSAKSGDGEEIYVGRFSKKNSLIGTIGPAYNVIKSGNDYAHALYFSSKPTNGIAMSDKDESGKSIAFYCFQKSNVLSTNTPCTQLGNNNEKISFDEVINKLYQYTNQKNVQGMDKNAFLSMVIEADYKKYIAMKEQLKDDPPVAGTRLSQSGVDDSPVKPKKKSKKKS